MLRKIFLYKGIKMRNLPFSVKTLFFTLVLSTSLYCQPVNDSDLRSIETLGRELFDYDQACWIASDSVMASNPDQSMMETFAAYEENNLWKVGFGKVTRNADAFLLAYEAVYDPQTRQCKVTSYRTPLMDTGFYLKAVKALEKMFEVVSAANPPYNFAVLPKGPDSLYLYFYPAQTSYNTYRFGGDTRYTYSIEKNTILDTLKLHNSILNMPYVKDKTQDIKATISTAIATDMPAETDILYVLSRKFPAEHNVIAQDWVFVISPEGKIAKYPADKFKELKPKQ